MTAEGKRLIELAERWAQYGHSYDLVMQHFTMEELTMLQDAMYQLDPVGFDVQLDGLLLRNGYKSREEAFADLSRGRKAN